jgi:hypothetical protein
MPRKTRRELALGAALAGLLAAGTVAHAEMTELTVNRCLAGKIKSVGESVAARTGCSSKEAHHGTADPPCHQKAIDQFTGGGTPGAGVFEKLEGKYPSTGATPCRTFDDQGTFETAIATYAASVSIDTGAAVGRCDAAKIKCVGRYIAAVSACDAKAARKTSTIDLGCTYKAAGKLANGVTGCLDKAGAAADCSNAGSQSSALRAASDTFIHDSLCALDPDNPGCVVPPARFIDNGDGTVTDQETGLQWEQKTGSAAGFTDCSATPCLDPHAATNAYQWCGDVDHDGSCDDIFFLGFPVWPPNGGAFTDFLSTLNAGSGFAGHTDWRVPTIEELGVIRLAPFFCSTHPCIDPAFGPTPSARYWSSSDYIDVSFVRTNAWFVDFGNGYVGLEAKTTSCHVRAVRGGP